MYRNPEYVKELELEVKELHKNLADTRKLLAIEKSMTPEGYRKLYEGEIVSKDAVYFEPHHGVWYKRPGNCAGEKINSRGFVDGIVHAGWKFANPIKEEKLTTK